MDSLALYGNGDSRQRLRSFLIKTLRAGLASSLNPTFVVSAVLLVSVLLRWLWKLRARPSIAVGKTVTASAQPYRYSDCPLCYSFKRSAWMRVTCNERELRCHVDCVADGGTSTALAWKLGGELVYDGTDLVRDVRALIAMTNSLREREPTIRICTEEVRLHNASEAWPPREPMAAPLAVYLVEGLVELRISSCAELTHLPKEIGRCVGLTALVLMSNRLEELPEEIGCLSKLTQLFLNGNFLRRLPESVGTLPSIQEVCLDANRITQLPRFESQSMTMLCAPGNCLVEPPTFAGRMERVELQGNMLPRVIFNPEAWWSKMDTIKLMGNNICVLPQEIGHMRTLRTLNVAANKLRSLPSGILNLRVVEWFYVYNNALVELPAGLLTRCPKISTLLVEGNPLSGQSLAGLFEDAAKSWVKVVAVDSPQMSSFVASQTSSSWELPSCVTAGNLLDTGSPHKYYAKLARCSQLRRTPGLLPAGVPGGPEMPKDSPAKMLVVAFAASQSEPEWLGALRRMSEESPELLPPPRGPLTRLFDEAAEGTSAQWAKAGLAALWAGCSDKVEAPRRESPGPGMEDFDILCLIDHTMRWYVEDFDAMDRMLAETAARYERVVFVGASMGGFASLVYGGRHADTVVAFGPQTRLDTATLRPSARDASALEELHRKAWSSVACGKERGASMEIHCAADDHFWHGLNVPLQDLALTVHPLLPRKPFARILGKGNVLQPILSDVMARTLLRPPAAVITSKHAPPAQADTTSWNGQTRVFVASWSPGQLHRYESTREEVLRLFFGRCAPLMPRPGDWFCVACKRHTMSSRFFCQDCGVDVPDAWIGHPGVAKIPGGRNYPRSGDWGCGYCCAALFGYQHECSRCGRSKYSHSKTVVVQ